MNELYTCMLKTGESIIFKTNMPKEEVQRLPIFSNQHKFYSYFQSKGYNLEIDLIIKQSPGIEKNQH